ncbi:MAG TPA: hemolysin family protein [Polyangiaceae bacterium]|nr:hemolysin family protein [Polyangiaceae bacterium]
MLVFCLAVALALLLSFVAALSEAVLLSVRHAQIEALGKTRAGLILRRFKREIDVPIAAILVLNTIAATAGASIVGATFVAVWDESKLWVFTIFFTAAVLLLGEFVPKTLGVMLADRLAVPVAYVVRALVFVLQPILLITRTLSRLLSGGKQTPVTSLDEIRLLASLGHSEGVVRKNMATMIEGAIALRELKARDVMVPRGGMSYLSAERSIEDNLRIVRQSGHSRFPFTSTGDPHDISGVILTKDLLFAVHENPDEVNWDSLVSKPLVVPASMPLERLLQTFREERRHLALVVDEYGGTQGLVTLEDVLEEIVGEIEDESDRVNPFITKRADGSLLCRGWAETRKVFEALDAEVDSEAVTIGGFVAENVGRMPRVGDVLRYGPLEIRVLQASARRAEAVQVRRVTPSTGPA